MSTKPRIAIVGLGGLFPDAPTPDHLWRNVLARHDAAREPPAGRWVLDAQAIYAPGEPKPDKVPSVRACFLGPFAVEAAGLNIDRELLAQLDPVFHLALEASRRAWASAVTDTLDRRRVGVILGAIALPTDKTSALTRHVLGRALYKRLDRPCPFVEDEWPHPLNVHATGLPAGLVAHALGLGGCAFTLDAACASSLYALKLAVDELQAGRVDAMLAGGVSRPDSLYTQMGFAQLRALSPSGRCSPFDGRGDGLVVGEGAGVFVLKRLDDARRDGDRVHAVIAGVGLSNDVEGGLLAPASEGQLRAMRAAYQEAGWRADEVDLVECHATGTPTGDAVEFRSLQTLWGDYSGPPGRCVLGAVKSTVGHLLTAAGAAAVTKVLFALADGTLPPTANFESAGLGMERSPFRVLREAEAWPARSDRPRRAAVSGFGFGGINAHLLLEEPSAGTSSAIVASDASVGIVTVAVSEEPPLGLPSRWWGVEAVAPAGHYLTEVSLPAARYRIPPREVEEMLPQQVVLLDVAGRAIEAARLTDAERLKTGVFVGVGLDLNTTNFHLRWATLRHDSGMADEAGPPLTANRTMGALASIAASRVARVFRLGGPAFTVSSTQTSGLTALHLAAEALRRGEIDAAVVGAVDLPGDVRATIARGRGVPRDGAVAVVLRRGDGVARVEGVQLRSGGRLGGDEVGAASGLRALVEACRVGDDDLLPPPRPGEVHSAGDDGSTATARLTLGVGVRDSMPRTEGLFVIEGDTPAELLRELEGVEAWLDGEEEHIDPLTRRWLRRWTPRREKALAMAFVPRTWRELLDLLAKGREHLTHRPQESLPRGPERVYYSPSPLRGKVAFVYPGSGNDHPGMGRDVARLWPGILARQAAHSRDLRAQYLPELYWASTAATPTVQQRLFAQVAVGTLVTDLIVDELGVRPDAAIGYSLGESSMLFGLRAWRDRDEMLARMHASPLFVTDLTGRCDAARVEWGVDRVDWRTAIVERSADEVRRALAGLERVYLQVINTPGECVIGGERAMVEEVGRRLGCGLVAVPETTTMHCAVARPVAAAYRELHRLPVTPTGVRFYSAGWGRAFDVDEASAADAIVAQAIDTIDFPRVVEAAYADGVRVFVEVGPGAACTRMIRAILGDRPHVARSVGEVWRAVAQLVVERVGVRVEGLYGVEREGERVRVAVGGEGREREPASPMANKTEVQRVEEVIGAKVAAHGAFLRYDAAMRASMEAIVAFQASLVERMLGGEVVEPPPPAARFDRGLCLEFAVGKIANVLGDAFAEADTFPTRVRLPDEPLMLVDRILAVEGEPLSLSHGRVVTEHDVLHEGWYLDAGRIPTCVAVEAGQADLFLSAYLGIDRHTRGLAVYRLLDAVVTFHGPLPVAGQVIRYDIHIDSFFRQGETILFRFHFVGTVDGRPLLTMTDGCAGFFSEGELAAGKGVVLTDLQRRRLPGVVPDDEAFLPSMAVERYDAKQIDALRQGDLAACFGPRFANLALRSPMRLPGGRMRLVHRVAELDPRGGRFGVGVIRAEADIHPDDWFLTCHFIDDQVMPGTLMYECCLHTLRIFLLRLGWVGEHSVVVCEPVPGVASRLRCRGQVTASTKLVTYEVVLKERGYAPDAYALADAFMYADGKLIVEITDMSLRLTGLTRERVEAAWAAPQPLFDRRHILAFAVGDPSEAFGDHYRPFDRDRFLARLPAPPYSFLDRVVSVTGEPAKMMSGGRVVAEYDVPPDEWYFASERSPVMPFAVLLEIPLQVCGWMAAYIGSALTSPQALHFRNLGGEAELLRCVTPTAGTLTSTIGVTRVAASGGMIIQDYTMQVADRDGVLYRGSTTFGFFSAEALAQQIGIRDATLFEASGEAFGYPQEPPFPDDMLRMIDRVESFDPTGGPHKLGFIEGTKRVRPEEWFFDAHFYQDPVMPGSLGLEAFIQLLKIVAVRRWGTAGRFEVNLGTHRWLYRGQVIRKNKQTRVQAVVTACDDAARTLTADGYLSVDGLVIYRMQGFTLLQCE